MTNSSTLLSEREFQVLKLLVDGFSNKKIAAELDISVDTVKCHMKSILLKLNARSRTQAAIEALKAGLI